MKKLIILGSTGSIGRSTLNVVRQYPEDFKVVGLSGNSNQKLLAEQIREFSPEYVTTGNFKTSIELKELCKGLQIELIDNNDSLTELASRESDLLLAALSGAKGLRPVIKAIENGVDIALANKEVLVMAGALVNRLASEKDVRILPVDSEHNAIFQCLKGEKHSEVQRLILCASGGPFFRTPIEDFSKITIAKALDHPRWKMGRKVTIDSATMFNKGLEMIEARWLFNVRPDQIDIVVHPQALIHSMVEFVDGSIIAQIGRTDMEMPIQNCLTFPERRINKSKRMNLKDLNNLEFYEPDMVKYPSIRLARQALEDGAVMPIVLNAADEVAVKHFLEESISFSEISRVVELSMNNYNEKIEHESLDGILEIDRKSREIAERIINDLAN